MIDKAKIRAAAEAEIALRTKHHQTTSCWVDTTLALLDELEAAQFDLTNEGAAVARFSARLAAASDLIEKQREAVCRAEAFFDMIEDPEDHRFSFTQQAVFAEYVARFQDADALYREWKGTDDGRSPPLPCK